MRKLTSIVLLSIYALVSVGVTVLVHTCGGYKTVEVMPTSTEDPCCCDNAISAEPCCKLVVNTIQLNDDQRPASLASAPSLDFVFTDFARWIAIPDGGHIGSPAPIDTSPPTSSPLTVLHCTFLI